ncbi:MAG: glycosyltransferase family 4 protein [Clostridia bacterium]|nr:glycosyltransferase family 4 protein [Clostridia bacterium]
MKIVHLCLSMSYSDNYSYQENMLPKFHKAAGYDVEIIASRLVFDENGDLTRYCGPMEYTNSQGIKITRLNNKAPAKVYEKMRRYKGTLEELKRAKPDILFIHGCQFLDADKVSKYLKKHRDVKVFVDNHGDFHNSAQNFISKNILHAVIWKKSAHKLLPYAEMFYGVLPARVDFLKDFYKLPADKCELLLMGADDDEVEKALEPSVREGKRKEYGASDEDILILAGGKIDHNKPQILLLMKAVNEIADKHIRLLVFGSVSPELQAEFENQLSNYVKHIGWKTSNEIYSEFAAADLVAFPGLHSVLWEQAVGMGKPCIFRKMEGFTHIDLGGNCLFFEKDTAEEYKRVIEKAIERKDRMKSVAEKKGMDVFSYKNIAKRALEH